MADEMDSSFRGNDGNSGNGGGSWHGGSGGGPLKGIRVVEMGQLIAIPFAMKLLADMGAEVIRLESTRRLESYRSDSVYLNEVEGEFWNRGANFYEQNRNKLGITLDLGRPEGLEILRRLVSVSDVFAENFTPRVIRNFGLEYGDLRRIKPDIIMVSSTGYGFDGPWANFGATGPATEGASGLAYTTGYRDGPPVMAEIPYVDYTAGEHTVFRRDDGTDAPPADRAGAVYRRVANPGCRRHDTGGAVGFFGKRDAHPPASATPTR